MPYIYQTMLFKNHKGNIIEINKNKFVKETKFYIELWKKKYNINIQLKKDTNKSIIDYIKGNTKFIA